MVAAPDTDSAGEREYCFDTALLIVDIFNAFDFRGGERTRAAARSAAVRIAGLRAEAAELGAPVVFVNDHFGRWHADRDEIVEGFGDPEIVRLLAPGRNDLFVAKPHLSAFYATTLPALLPRLGVGKLVITGVATEACVQYTAADAHMREYKLWVPQDCVASITGVTGAAVLDVMRVTLDAETRGAAELGIGAWSSRVGKADS